MGRPKGAKNRITKSLIEKCEAVEAYLEKKGKGLRECANEDPAWYYENFLKPRIPKNVDVNMDGELKVSWDG